MTEKRKPRATRLNKTHGAVPASENLPVTLSEPEDEGLIEQLFEVTSDALLLINVANRQIVKGNRGVTHLLGYSLTQLIGQPVSKIVPISNWPLLFEQFEKTTTSRVYHQIEVQHYNSLTIPFELISKRVSFKRQPHLLWQMRNIEPEREFLQILERYRINSGNPVGSNPGTYPALPVTSQLKTILDVALLQIKRTITYDYIVVFKLQAPLEVSIGEYHATRLPPFGKLVTNLSETEIITQLTAMSHPLVISDYWSDTGQNSRLPNLAELLQFDNLRSM